MTLRRRLVVVSALCVAVPLAAMAVAAPFVADAVLTGRGNAQLDAALVGAHQVVAARQAALQRDVNAAATRLGEGLAPDDVAGALVTLGQADAAAVTGPGRPPASLPTGAVLEGRAPAPNQQTVVAVVRLAPVIAALGSSGSVSFALSAPAAGQAGAGHPVVGHAAVGGSLTASTDLGGGVRLTASRSRRPVVAGERTWALVGIIVLLVVIALVVVVGGRVIDATARPLARIVRWAESAIDDAHDPPTGELSVDRIALAVGRVARDLRTRSEELDEIRGAFRQSLERLGAVLASSHDTDGIVQVVVDTALLSVPADAAVYYRLVSMPAALEAINARGAVCTGLTLDGNGVAGYAALTLDVTALPGPALLAANEPPAVAAVAVPVVSLGRLIGVVAVYGTSVGRPFNDDEVGSLQTLVHQAEVALANVELHAQARREALIDGVTGLWNRRHFDLRCRDAQAAATRFGEPYAVILFDIDDFKAVNDNYDHFTGDAALIHLSAILRRSSREVDVVARWGGEEFAILVERAGYEEATVVAERVRAMLVSDPAVYKGEIIRFTVSAGVACSPDSGATPAEVVAAADAALLRAKAAGKDRVERAERSASAPLARSRPGTEPSGSAE
jgi:diguanylate cyclase (GGDEF)-like protein